MALYRCEIFSPVDHANADSSADELAARVAGILTQAGIPDVDTRWSVTSRMAAVQACFVADSDAQAHAAVNRLRFITGVTGAIDVCVLGAGCGQSDQRIAS